MGKSYDQGPEVVGSRYEFEASIQRLGVHGKRLGRLRWRALEVDACSLRFSISKLQLRVYELAVACSKPRCTFMGEGLFQVRDRDGDGRVGRYVSPGQTSLI